MGTSAITFGNYDDTVVATSIGAVAVGDPLLSTSGEIIGFSMLSCTGSGSLITYRVRGRCDNVPKATGDPWAIGQLLYWDSTNTVATRTPTAYPLGFAASVQAAADTSGSVILCASRQSVGPLYSPLAASTTLTNWTTFTAFSNGTYTVPANFLAAGRRLHISGRVTYVAVNSTNTFQTIVKFAGTQIIATIARNPAAGDVARFDADVLIRTSGASGTWVADGTSWDGAIGAAPATNVYAVSSTAIDTTSATANTVIVGAVNSVASTGNQAIMDRLSIQAW